MPDRVLRHLGTLAARCGARAWCVGGWVRDRLLARTPADLDLLIEGDAASLAGAIATQTGRAPVILARDGVTVRRFSIEGTCVDLSSCPEGGLREELARRDLTINAMACPLAADGPDLEDTRDFFGGLEDLARRRVRFTSERAILDDPLRALRAIRMTVVLDGFALDSASRDRIRNHAAKVAPVPVERRTAECDLILATPRAGEGVRILEDTGLCAVLFPWLEPLRGLTQNRWHAHDAFDHTLRAVEECDRWIAQGAPGIPAENLDDEDAVTLKWAALLHDAGKAATARPDGAGGHVFHGHEVHSARIARGAAESLRFSGRRAARLVVLVENHLRILLLAALREATDRAIRRLVHRAGWDTPLLCLLALADCAASGGDQVEDRVASVGRIVGRAMRVARDEGDAVIAPKPLLSGHDVMEILGCGPGPRVGAAQRWITRLQVDGRITTRDEAVAILRSLTPSGFPPGGS